MEKYGRLEVDEWKNKLLITPEQTNLTNKKPMVAWVHLSNSNF